jgi:hypothetical protein
MGVSAFFDESGNFKDHAITCLGSVSGFEEDFMHHFAPEWKRLLHLNGLKVLSAKDVLNPNRPISKKNQNVGLKKRINDLFPFIACIRKHLQVVIGFAVDAEAFKKLPSHFHQQFGDKPSYLAFARSILQIVEWTPDDDKIALICDEDEEIAIPFYQLYKQIKREWPQAKDKLAAISFGDDKVFYGLQAADFVASILRQEEARRLKRTPYDYRPLYRALKRNPDKTERLWSVAVATGDESTLSEASKEMLELWKKRSELVREQQKNKTRR